MVPPGTHPLQSWRAVTNSTITNVTIREHNVNIHSTGGEQTPSADHAYVTLQ